MTLRLRRSGLLLLGALWLTVRPCYGQLVTSEQTVQLHGGRQLVLHCQGTGAPLVMLEAGYGSNSLTWRRLQPLLAKRSRVCSYDRAGERSVDSGPFPRDLNAMVSDLHDLVSSAGLPKPFVLVGHSMGGMSGLLYTERYRDDVEALVLLDPGMSGMLKAYKALPKAKGGNNEVFDGLVQLSHCRALSNAPDKKAELLTTCSWRDPELTREQNEEADRVIQRPAFWETLISTDMALRAPESDYDTYLNRFSLHKEAPLSFIPRADETLDERELRMAEHSLGRLPLVIVCVDSSPPDRQAWAIKRHQYEIKAEALSRNGRVVDVGNTTHNVQLDQPARVAEIVVSAMKTRP